MTKATNALDDTAKIARFLEMTSFGPKSEEISGLDVGGFGENERAAAVRAQMDLPKSSHREYFRRHANPKWDATTQNARSDHPCDPNSHWRDYAYIRQDRRHTITSADIYTTFEEAPEDENVTFTIYEVESPEGVTLNTGTIEADTVDNYGFSGLGYCKLAPSLVKVIFTVCTTHVYFLLVFIQTIWPATMTLLNSTFLLPRMSMFPFHFVTLNEVLPTTETVLVFFLLMGSL